jgi:hypothetical protein
MSASFLPIPGTPERFQPDLNRRSSFPRKQEAILKQAEQAVRWIPACAGMTASDSALSEIAVARHAAFRREQ